MNYPCVLKSFYFRDWCEPVLQPNFVCLCPKQVTRHRPLSWISLDRELPTMDLLVYEVIYNQQVHLQGHSRKLRPSLLLAGIHAAPPDCNRNIHVKRCSSSARFASCVQKQLVLPIFPARINFLQGTWEKSQPERSCVLQKKKNPTLHEKYVDISGLVEIFIGSALTLACKCSACTGKAFSLHRWDKIYTLPGKFEYSQWVQ